MFKNMWILSPLPVLGKTLETLRGRLVQRLIMLGLVMQGLIVQGLVMQGLFLPSVWFIVSHLILC